MRLLGLVEGISASGYLIVRASGRLMLRIGDAVYQDGKVIGKIRDVIGPVSKPWVLVESKKKLPAGAKLYLGD